MQTYESMRGERQEQIGQLDRVQDVRVDDRNTTRHRHSSVVQAEIFGLSGQLVERLTCSCVLAVPVSKDVHQAEPPVCSDHPERQRTAIEELDQMGPTHVQQVSRFNRRQLGLQRRNRDPVTRLEVTDDRVQCAHQFCRYFDGVTFGIDQPGRRTALAGKGAFDDRQLPRLDRTGPDLDSARHGASVRAK